MQVKNFRCKALFVLCLTVAIGISSAACNKELEQDISKKTVVINEESTVTVNNNVKDNKAVESNKASESSSSVENKTSKVSAETQKSVAQLNTTQQQSPKASTVPSSNSGTKGDVQLNVEPAQTSEPQTSAAPESTPAPTTSTDKQTLPAPPTKGNPTGNEIIAYASNFLGVRYLFGGTSPVDTNPDPNIDNSGFSDTGFVQYVFAHFDIAVGLNRREQIKVGVEVSREELQAGDIVFFGSNISSPVHVGIYEGDNTYIHSPSTGDVVKVSLITRTDFIAARRVIK